MQTLVAIAESEAIPLAKLKHARRRLGVKPEQLAGSTAMYCPLTARLLSREARQIPDRPARINATTTPQDARP